MLTAWIVCSTFLGLYALVAELWKGSDLPTSVMGAVATAVLWPVVVVLCLLCLPALIIWGIKGD